MFCGFTSMREFFRCSKCKKLNSIVVGRLENITPFSNILYKRIAGNLPNPSQQGLNLGQGVSVALVLTSACPRCGERHLAFYSACNGISKLEHLACSNCGYFTNARQISVVRKPFALRPCPKNDCGGVMYFDTNIGDAMIFRCDRCETLAIYNISDKIVETKKIDFPKKVLEHKIQKLKLLKQEGEQKKYEVL